MSDEGSGAWLGLEAIRRALWAHDQRIGWSPLLSRIMSRFSDNPHAVVRWAASARPADFGGFAPLVIEHAGDGGDPVARELVRLAAEHIDRLATQLVAVGAERIALVGGLAAAIEPHLAPETRRHLVQPQGDALVGALRIAASAMPTRDAAE